MDKKSIKELLDEFYVNREFHYFVNYFLKNTQDLEELIQLSLQFPNEKDGIIGSWLCTHIVSSDKKRYAKYYDSILYLLQKETNQSSLRNWMKVLSFLETPKDKEGLVIELCVQKIENPKNKVALQVYSVLVLIPLMKKYPELIPEINALLELHSEGKSAAFHSIYRKFKKITKKF